MPVPVGTGPILWQENFTYSDGELSSLAPSVWKANWYDGTSLPMRVISNQAGSATQSWKDIYTDATYGDADYEFTIKAVPETLKQFFFAILSGTYTERGNSTIPSGIVLRFQRETSPGVDRTRLQTWPDGSGAATTLIDSQEANYAADQKLLIRRIGSTVGLYRNNSGSWVQIGTDQSFSGVASPGRIALMSDSGTIRIDNLIVRSTEESAVTVNPSGLASSAAQGAPTARVNVSLIGQTPSDGLGTLIVAPDTGEGITIGDNEQWTWIATLGGQYAPMVPVDDEPTIFFTAEVRTPPHSQQEFAWEELYKALTPMHYAEDQTEYALRRFCEALMAPMEMAYWLIRDEPDGKIGWSILLDPNRAPDEMLDWLQQITGIIPIKGHPPTVTRQRIKSGEAFKRGTLKALYDAAALQGATQLQVQERHNGSAWQIRLLFKQSQWSPEVERFIAHYIPAGIKYEVGFWDGVTYATIAAEYADYDEARVNNATYSDLRGA